MSVDLDKINVGDEVVVRGVVDRLDHGTLYRRVSVQFPSYISGFWIPGEAVVSHTPKDIEVGDRVRHAKGLDMKWEVVAPPRSTTARPERRVAVWNSDHGYAVFEADDLERVND